MDQNKNQITMFENFTRHPKLKLKQKTTYACTLIVNKN